MQLASSILNVTHSLSFIDTTTLYVLRHDAKKKQYWLSRSITDPKEMADTLCWLVLLSNGSSDVAMFDDAKWKEYKRLDDAESDPIDLGLALKMMEEEEEPDNFHALVAEENEMLDKLSHYLGYYDLAQALFPEKTEAQTDSA